MAKKSLVAITTEKTKSGNGTAGKKRKVTKARAPFVGMATLSLALGPFLYRPGKLRIDRNVEFTPGKSERLTTTLPALSGHRAVLCASTGAVIAITGPMDDAEARADATLLAGGQELLAAARKALAFAGLAKGQGTPGAVELFDALGAAIAKVTVTGGPLPARKASAKTSRAEPALLIKAPTHGYGDPNAEMPGDRPEAYTASLTEEQFHQRYGGSFEDSVQYVTYPDGTQSHGKLLPNHKPMAGYEVDDKGYVVRCK